MAQIIPRQKPAPAASPSTSPSRGPARAGSAMAAPGARHRPRRGLMTSARGDNGALRGAWSVCACDVIGARGDEATPTACGDSRAWRGAREWN